MSETTTIERYWVGEDARLRVRFYLEDKVTPAAAATGVRFSVKVPGVEAPAIYEGADVISEGEGSFYIDHRVTASGRHRWRAECSGPTASADEGAFDGIRSAVLA